MYAASTGPFVTPRSRRVHRCSNHTAPTIFVKIIITHQFRERVPATSRWRCTGGRSSWQSLALVDPANPPTPAVRRGRATPRRRARPPSGADAWPHCSATSKVEPRTLRRKHRVEIARAASPAGSRRHRPLHAGRSFQVTAPAESRESPNFSVCRNLS